YLTTCCCSGIGALGSKGGPCHDFSKLHKFFQTARWQRAMNLKNSLCEIYPYKANFGHGCFSFWWL
ncbi:MAG: hypothetical protein ACI92Z_002145, partial [Paracoccaceae bacterium]